MFIDQMSAMSRRGVRASVALATMLACTACQRPADPGEPAESSRSAQLNWARSALQRNPDLEIIATDTAAGVFTVRIRRSGDVRTVKFDEIAAAPLSELLAQARPTASATSEPMSETPPAMAAQSEPAPAPPTTASATADAVPRTEASVPISENPNYRIERTGGQLKVSGPGVSIVSSGRATETDSRTEGGQRTVDPIICDGKRMLHLDSRNLRVQGDAIIARDGCDLHITNSRITATGTGIMVRNAVVHISNSTIEGGTASFDADDARLFLRGSTFSGLPRRGEKAEVQDQGGNQWK